MAPHASSRWSDTFVLREATLSLTLPRVGKTAGELYRDVQDDYGSCGERRFYRILRFLVDGGFVVARRELHDELNQEVTLYFRARPPADLSPTKIKHTCKICGMIGTDTKFHPLHLRHFRELNGSRPQYRTLATPGSRPGAR
jgi:Fe2+ or Zn2+ uptake regulation protein